MSESLIVNMPEPSSYGAVEIKKWIVKNTYRGFIYTLSIFVLLVLINWISSIMAEETTMKIIRPPVSKIDMLKLQPMNDNVEDAPPPPPQEVVVKHGPAARAGTPNPVPDAEIAEDLQEFASMDVIDRASAEGGDGLDFGDFADDIDWDGSDNKKVENVQQEYIPPPDEFIPVEIQPQIDLVELQKRIDYPEMAKRAGISGKVIIRVWVTKDGKPKKAEVLKSDSKMLNDAALKAVQESTFTPAIQNNKSVGCWVTIPIVFTLE